MRSPVDEARHQITVEDIMTQDVIAVGPRTSLAAVVQLFLHHNITGAPVVDEEGRPLGMVTSTDLIDPSHRSTAVGLPRYYRMWRGDVRIIGITEEGEVL